MATRGSLTHTNVVFGETTFAIQRALPLEAFQIFEALRPGLASVSEAVQTAFSAEAEGVDRHANALGTAVAIVGKLPAETVQVAMTKLLRHVTFMREGLGAPRVAAQDLESAFKGMSVFQIYELLVRAFCVNFTESFDDLRSLWGTLQAEDTSGPET